MLVSGPFSVPAVLLAIDAPHLLWPSAVDHGCRSLRQVVGDWHLSLSRLEVRARIRRRPARPAAPRPPGVPRILGTA